MKTEADEKVDLNELDERNRTPSQLVAFVMSNSKRKRNDFMMAIDGFPSNRFLISILIHNTFLNDYGKE